MSDTYDRTSKVLDGKDKSFVACRVDESCGQAPPVSPDGGEVEVVGYVVADSMFFLELLQAEEMSRNGKYKILEVVDRAHFTRLQAENAALQQRLNVADQRVDDLQSELTRARESNTEMLAMLITWMRFYSGEKLGPILQSMVRRTTKIVSEAHQSAPAAKGEGDE